MGLEAFGRDDLDRAGYVIPGEQRDRTVTPFFRYESIFNEPQSRLQGKPIHDLKEVVEIRFAGDRTYKPVFGVEEMCDTNADTGAVVTWAERYKLQYQAFLSGSEQEADGTPLEELLPYGISQAQLSLCRALNIYSVEAMANVTEQGRKRLGQHGNDLIPMARRYLDARRDGAVQQTELNELRRQLAELQADKMRGLGEEPMLSNRIPEAIPALPGEHDDMSDVQIKDEIERLTGARPRGNPARATIVALYEQAKAAA